MLFYMYGHYALYKYSFVEEFPVDIDFVMKAPFVTNRKHFHYYPKDGDAAIAFLKCSYRKMYIKKNIFAVPYLMLQERVKNNTEVKLIFLNGIYHHTMSCAVSSVQMSFTGISAAQLIDFANSVMESISAHEEYIVDGLVRIDLFRNNAGELVVNELESLEARYFTLDSNILASCVTFLQEYWEKKIYSCIDSFVESR